MDLINSIPLIGPVLGWALPFLIVLSVVVAIHELGHLMVGRWCGIKAEVYSIGFGKVLWSRVDKHGTKWQIALLPLGGFVKFVGDMDPASAGRADDADLSPQDRAQAFHNAALWRRALTVLAGPVANFLLSIILFFGVALAIGKASNEPVITSIGDLDPVEIGFQAGDRVLSIGGQPTEKFTDIVDALAKGHGSVLEAQVLRDGAEQTVSTKYQNFPRIDGMQSDGAALAAGVRPGDTIRAIDGTPVASVRDVITTTINLPPGKEIALSLLRDGDEVEIRLTPEVRMREHPETGEEAPLPLLGISMSRVQGLESPREAATLYEAGYFGVYRVWQIITDTVTYINRMLFHGATTEHLSGPIGIANYSAQAASQGLIDLIGFVAAVSTAIGFLNLFPIPILDGGHLMFYIAEAIRGRPVGEASIKYGTMVGLSLVLLLMVFVTYNDVMKL